jgi:hypothetical protein
MLPIGFVSVPGQQRFHIQMNSSSLNLKLPNRFICCQATGDMRRMAATASD